MAAGFGQPRLHFVAGKRDFPQREQVELRGLQAKHAQVTAFAGELVRLLLASAVRNVDERRPLDAVGRRLDLVAAGVGPFPVQRDLPQRERPAEIDLDPLRPAGEGAAGPPGVGVAVQGELRSIRIGMDRRSADDHFRPGGRLGRAAARNRGEAGSQNEAAHATDRHRRVSWAAVGVVGGKKCRVTGAGGQNGHNGLFASPLAARENPPQAAGLTRRIATLIIYCCNYRFRRGAMQAKVAGTRSVPDTTPSAPQSTRPTRP